MMATKFTGYRFEPQTVETIDALSDGLAISRTDVVRRAVAAFRLAVLEASRATTDTIAELKARYGPTAEIVVFIEELDGHEQVSLRIDGEVPADVQTWPIIPPTFDHVLVLLTVGDVDQKLITLGQLTGVVPGLCVGRLAWPPVPGTAVVSRVSELAPQIHEAAAKRLVEAVEA